MTKLKKGLKLLLANLTRAVARCADRVGQSTNIKAPHRYAWANVAPELMPLFSTRIDAATKHDFMAAAIAEARQSGLYPTVGAVVVKDGEIIGRGHRCVNKIREAPPRWRVRHAEQVALQNADVNAQGATLYVTLEPCAERYIGATVEPAEVCSKLIPRAGIACVVVGLIDHDPMTCGKGLKRLHAAGIRLEYTDTDLDQELLKLVDDGHFGVLPASVPLNA